MADARRAAVAALMKQEQNGYSNLVLKSALAHFPGDAREKAFVSAVFYGVTERMLTIDYCLGLFLKKPLNKLDPAVRAILRAGLYQVRWMDSVPAHAAVSESVRLCRSMGKSSAAGLVNAVLRRAGSVDVENAVFDTPQQRLSVLYSVSPSVLRCLEKSLGGDTERFLQAQGVPPRLCVRVNTLKTTARDLTATLEREGVPVERGFDENCLYLGMHGDVASHPLFREGMFHVQSEASQFACALLGAKPGQTVLDACAAPGGKSATLAQYMENRGTLISRDAAPNRVPLIDETFRRLGITCGRTLCADASEPSDPPVQADAVLCDVPCSGLGVMAKKPDIRYKDVSDLAPLCELQKKILTACAKCVKPGGRLVYSTCTVNRDENEAVVESFLKENPDFASGSIAAAPDGAHAAGGCVNFNTFDIKTDGFFTAILERL